MGGKVVFAADDSADHASTERSSSEGSFVRVCDMESSVAHVVYAHVVVYVDDFCTKKMQTKYIYPKVSVLMV